MARLVCTYQLRQRTDASGNLIVRSDNTAAGLIVLLTGLVWAGLWVALLSEDPGWRRMYDLWREPSRFDAAQLNRLADEVDRIAKEAGIKTEPLPRFPERRPDPGGFDWERLGLLALTHGIPLIAILIGLWLLFAHTRLVFDAHEGGVRWERVRPFHTRRSVYPFGEVALVLRPKVIPGKGWDWIGFALTLVAGDGRELELARNKRREMLLTFAAPLQERGVELREIEEGKSTSGVS